MRLDDRARAAAAAGAMTIGLLMFAVGLVLWDDRLMAAGFGLFVAPAVLHG